MGLFCRRCWFGLVISHLGLDIIFFFFFLFLFQQCKPTKYPPSHPIFSGVCWPTPSHSMSEGPHATTAPTRIGSFVRWAHMLSFFSLAPPDYLVSLMLYSYRPSPLGGCPRKRAGWGEPTATLAGACDQLQPATTVRS